ncbi:MAG TPA: GntG family PLP-dependent aldolase [Flavobacteriales bacterium]|nr:GntG family PLP-dependent aldolase [Flavobacteriales bacterium]
MLPIDLRSDTVTKPTPSMLAAMMQAVVGDDVYGEDPTVNGLEEHAAALFGQEAALFCVSGTMANQVAIRVHTQPGDEVICEEGAHVYRYEGGGIMANSGCSVHLLAGNRGRFTAAQVAAAIHDAGNPHFPTSRLVCVENSSNRGGGSVWDLHEVTRIRACCDQRGLALHMDGARLFNAMAVDGTTPEQWGSACHSISICLSKGLGAPVGSVLIGPKEFIVKARRVRKRLGGGMRQAGYLAAAGKYALDHNVERLPEDHRRAQELASLLAAHPLIAGIMPVETNIVIATLIPEASPEEFLAQLRKRHILAAAFGPQMIRFVTHLQIGDAEVAEVSKALNTLT